MPVTRNCSPQGGLVRPLGGAFRHRGRRTVPRWQGTCPPARKKQPLPAQHRERPLHRPGPPPSRPAPPAIMWKPVIRPQRCGGYHKREGLDRSHQSAREAEPDQGRRATIQLGQRAPPGRTTSSRGAATAIKADLQPLPRPVAVERHAQHRHARPAKNRKNAEVSRPEGRRQRCRLSRLEIRKDDGV